MLTPLEIVLCLAALACGAAAAWATPPVAQWAKRKMLLSIFRGVREARGRLIDGPWSAPFDESMGKE